MDGFSSSKRQTEMRDQEVQSPMSMKSLKSENEPSQTHKRNEL